MPTSRYFAGENPWRRCNGAPSILRRKKRIASIIAVDVPDVLRAKPRSRVRDGNGRIASRMHFQPLPRRCMHSAAMRRYSSQAEEHQKHTGARIECIRSGRYARWTRARLRTAPFVVVITGFSLYDNTVSSKKLVEETRDNKRYESIYDDIVSPRRTCEITFIIMFEYDKIDLLSIVRH